MSRFNEAYASAQRTQEEMVAQRREKAREELTAETMCRSLPGGIFLDPERISVSIRECPRGDVCVCLRYA